MKTQHILMAFEELLQTLFKANDGSLITRHLRMNGISPTLSTAFDSWTQSPLFFEWLEKYKHTWWEVIQPLEAAVDPNTTRIQQCIYIADSLSDAIRLRPDLPISLHSFPLDSMESALNDSGEWPAQIAWDEGLEIKQFL